MTLAVNRNITLALDIKLTQTNAINGKDSPAVLDTRPVLVGVLAGNPLMNVGRLSLSIALHFRHLMLVFHIHFHLDVLVHHRVLAVAFLAVGAVVLGTPK